MIKNKFWNWRKKGYIFVPEKASYVILRRERKLEIFKLFITMFDVFKMFNRKKVIKPRVFVE